MPAKRRLNRWILVRQLFLDASRHLGRWRIERAASPVGGRLPSLSQLDRPTFSLAGEIYVIETELITQTAGVLPGNGEAERLVARVSE